MEITLDIPPDEMALLTQEANAQNAKFNLNPPLDAYTLAMNQFTGVGKDFIAALKEKYGVDKLTKVQLAIKDPAKLATAAAALGIQ